MKKYIALALLATFFLLLLTSCKSESKRESMQWAKNLKVEDVEEIEAVSKPSNTYKNYDTSEFQSIVDIVNTANGKYIKEPEVMVGGFFTYYITTKDGVRHTFSTDGGSLYINGDAYKADKDWLYSWGMNEEFDSKVPSDFKY